MLKLSPQFVRELEKSNRKIFGLLEVQSAGVSDEATTEAHWGANVGESNVDYDGATNPPPASGDVILAVHASNTLTESQFPSSIVQQDAEWSGSLSDIDDDSDADYATCGGTGGSNKDFTFNLPTLDIPNNATIVSVTVRERARVANDSGHSNYVGLITGAGTDWQSKGPLTGSFVQYEHVYTNNPDTAAPWTVEEVASIVGVGLRAATIIGTEVRVSSLKIIVTYKEFQTSGYIEVELDLAGANTENDMIVSIDDVVPDGGTLTHGLYYPNGPTAEMHPAGAFDNGGFTTDESNAYDNNPTTYSSTVPIGTGPVFYVGRDTGNNDQWDVEPHFTGTVYCYVTAERVSGTGSMSLEIRTSAGVMVGTVISMGAGNVSKQTFSVDVTPYVGDLADLRAVVTASTPGDTEMRIYEVWFEGDTWSSTALPIQDGARVANLGYELFAVRSIFASDGSVTPVLKSIGLEIPDRIYRFNSLGRPIFNSYPYMNETPGRSVKLDLRTWMTATSDLSIFMVKDELVLKMLQENSFDGLNADIYLGMYSDGMTESDLALVHRLLTRDYTISGESVTLKLSDPTADLLAVKVPIGSGTTKPTASYDGWHMVDVILDLIDKAGVRNRYVDRGSFDTLRSSVGDGTPAPPDFVVKRTGTTALTESRPAKDFITELLELLGAFLVDQGDGRLVAIEYDAANAAVNPDDPWDADDFIDDPTWEPGLGDARDVCRVWHDWDGSGDSETDYTEIYIAVKDADSDLIKDIRSKWIAGDSADGYYGAEIAQHVANREVDRLAGGLGKLSVRTHLDKFPVQVGDMVNVSHPDIIRNGIGPGDTVKFLVVQKDPPQGDTIQWKLVEAR